MTVQSLIASRLDALSPSEDLALKAASVMGDGFSVDLMARVYPGNQAADVIDALLTSLAERQLLARVGSDVRRFAFQHALIREVTYQQLTREQRRDLHRRVAETLEREHEADLRPHFATLAHHWSHAEAPDATMRYSDLAASQALAAGAFEEAERLLGTCIRLARESGHASRDRRAGFAGIVRWQTRVTAWASSSRAARRPIRPCASPASPGRIQRSRSSPRPAVRLVPAGRAPSASRARGRRSATTLDVARAFRHSAEVCYFNNDMLGMICDSIGAVAYASSLPPSAVLAGASTELGGILSIAGLRRIGERILHRAIAMAEAADDQAAQAYAHMISCLYYVGRGDWPSAERSARRCQELCEPMDDRVNWTNAQAVRFWMSHYRSHDAAAL